MEFETDQREGKMIDVLESEGLRAQVCRRGAELVGISLDGTGFLYRDGEVGVPSSGWGNHATVMGYFIHRLWRERSDYRGSTIRGGNHGFLRHFDFPEPVRLDDGLSYRVEAGNIPPEAYPLRVSLGLSYRIVAGGVRVEFAFLNEEPTLDAHVSFGLHPGFAVSNLSAARVVLPPGRYARHMAPGNFLDGEIETLDFPGGEFPYPREALPGSYLLGLEGVPHREFRIEDPARKTSVVLDFSEAPYVTFWSESPRYLCIEPCWGLPDHNPPLPFEQKAGIQVIPPGGTLRRGFTITPSLLT